MKALVTGGGGFLGKAVARQLVDRGDSVWSFSRGNYPELERLGVESLKGDLADFEAVREAVSGKDIVFHVAARAGVWGAYDEYYRTNVTGTENVVRACHGNGVKNLVYTSSPSTVFNGGDMEGVDETVPYADHFEAHYPKTKAIAEQHVLGANDEKLRTVALRPHLIWGPGDNHLVPRILARSNRLRIIGDGHNKVDTVYVDNAAQAHVLAGDRLAAGANVGGKVYFITQGEPMNLWDIINRILAAGGLPPITKRVSVKTAIAVGGLMEGLYRLFRLQGEPPMTRFVARELSTSHWFDISAARKDLGYNPEISFDEGMNRLGQWLKK